MNASFSVVQEQLSDIKTDVATLKTDVKELKETSITTAIFHKATDAMEDRLTQKIVGENRKLIAMARLLEQKKIFSAQEVQELFA